MTGLRSIGLRMFRWRSKRRVISVTRRHIDFLFGVSNVKQVRAVERIIKRNREETVVTTTAEYIEALNDLANADGTARLVASLREMPDDTELQLPPSDESKVGDDV